ncbi:MAG TPA: DUF3502 domain-containing protein [Candidatus Scybalocola faecigallinarum]|uniref:DUF3502 domain-containing protein n=1 Tax=Candidatus Scybalocola faecigallinarum TaxID=2840941 RepID=A0A9D1F2W1_9FIRM|nr:DUF3502 domain-containing protein [Candidatus Scybalocola faecigallinarum]
MIRHISIFFLKENVSENEKAQALEALRHVGDGMDDVLDCQAGADCMERPPKGLPGLPEFGNLVQVIDFKTRVMYVKSPAGEDYIDQMQAMEDEATVSPLAGYMFDDTNFQTESSVIYSTIQEYLPRLQNGMCDSEEATLDLIDEFVGRLEAAGINGVIEANQQQLNDYLAAQS